MAPKSKKAGPAKVEGGKGGRGGEVKKIRSKSVKAGLQFPVTRIGRYLKKGMKFHVYATSIRLNTTLFID